MTFEDKHEDHAEQEVVTAGSRRHLLRAAGGLALAAGGSSCRAGWRRPPRARAPTAGLWAAGGAATVVAVTSGAHMATRSTRTSGPAVGCRIMAPSVRRG